MLEDISTSRPEVERDSSCSYGTCRLGYRQLTLCVCLQLRHCSDGRNLIRYRNVINMQFKYFKRPSVFHIKSTIFKVCTVRTVSTSHQNCSCNVTIMTSRWQSCVTKHQSGLPAWPTLCEMYCICFRIFTKINIININTIHRLIYKCNYYTGLRLKFSCLFIKVAQLSYKNTILFLFIFLVLVLFYLIHG